MKTEKKRILPGRLYFTREREDNETGRSLFVFKKEKGFLLLNERFLIQRDKILGRSNPTPRGYSLTVSEVHRRGKL